MALGLIGSVARKLVNADAGGLLRMIEDYGKDALLDIVGGGGSPIGIGLKAFFRYSETVDRQYARQRAKEERDENRPLSAAQRRRYAQQHSQWLRDNRWRFDWRSQPRRPAGTPEGGEWMEGRLDYMAEQKKTYSRKQKREGVRAMKAYKARQRAAGNMKTRTIRSQWGDF